MLFRFILLSYLVVASTQNLSENETCGQNNARGVCKKPEDCSTFKNALKKGIRPPVCRYGSLPLICCPFDIGKEDGEPTSIAEQPTPQRKTTLQSSASVSRPNVKGGKSISQQKCEEYAQYVYEYIDVVPLPGAPKDRIEHCGWIADEQIVGGEDAKPKVYIHMALIGYGEDRDWQCGGSLISERFVLSAAHCNEVRKRPAAWVRLGELDLDSDTDDAEPNDFKIIERIIHPSYVKGKSYHDIALFKLESDVEFSPYIRPICLHNTRAIETGQSRPIVSGWGHTSFRGEFSSILQHLKVDIFNYTQCKARFKKYETSNSLIPNGINDELMLCAGGIRGEDACQGDSGGPLQIKLTNPFCMFSQIGVVSFGNKCAIGEPGVYTRISHYIPWIESIVWQS